MEQESVESFVLACALPWITLVLEESSVLRSLMRSNRNDNNWDTYKLICCWASRRGIVVYRCFQTYNHKCVFFISILLDVFFFPNVFVLCLA